MTRKQRPFYATERDLTALIQEVSEQRPLSFVKTGLFSEKKVVVIDNFEHREPLQSYLAFDRNKNVTVRKVSQQVGPAKYAVDQLENSHTVCIKCGGLVSETRLIAGQLGTVATGTDSDKIYSLLANMMRKKFKKIKSYYVGPEADSLLRSGIRLSPTEKSSPMIDLIS